MIRINLIPYEDRERPRRMNLPGRWSFVIYGVGLLVVLVIAGSYFVHARMLGQLDERLVELKEQEKRVAMQTQAIEEFTRRKALLHERLSMLRQLEAQRYTNIEWLNTLNGVIPGRLWLQQISHNQETLRSSLEGISTGYRPISDLMRAMEESGRFAAVQLVKAERQNTDKSSVIQFTVAASWSQSPMEVATP